MSFRCKRETITINAAVFQSPKHDDENNHKNFIAVRKIIKYMERPGSLVREAWCLFVLLRKKQHSRVRGSVVQEDNHLGEGYTNEPAV